MYKRWIKASCLTVVIASCLQARPVSLRAMYEASRAGTCTITDDGSVQCPTLDVTDDIISEILTSPERKIQLQLLLQKDLYKHTNTLNIRNLADLPSLRPVYNWCHRNGWSIDFQPFANIMKRCFFTKKSDKFASYANFNIADDFLNTIDVEEFNTLDIPEVLGLFGQISLEQRRIGGMFIAWWEHDRFAFSGAIPFYYLEHNFFLSEKKQQQVSDQALFLGGSGVVIPEHDFDTFVDDHLISDKAGVGDLRLQALFDVARGTNTICYIGGEITLPTAHIMRSPIIGGKFCKSACVPEVDLRRLIKLAINIQDNSNVICSQFEATQMVVNYGIDALDRLTANIADNSLGQMHTSLGPVFRLSQPIFHRTLFEIYADFQYVIPAWETRFFKVIKNPEDFNRDYLSLDPEIATENVNFLSTQATHTLYPTAVCLKVRPGMIGHASFAFSFDRESFYASVGYDVWGQGQEKFGAVNKRYQAGGPLDFAAGRKPSAFQGKIFASIIGYVKVDVISCRIGLRGDATVQNKGIGRDYTAAIDFIVDF